MTKILCSADWHILLHKKKVPYDWQVGRFKAMFRKLIALEQRCDVHIIAGDIFDKKPEPDEICLFLSYINSVTIPTYIIPGNHEATRKGESFFEYFTQENAIKNENVTVFTRNGRASVGQAHFCFFRTGKCKKIIYQSMWKVTYSLHIFVEKCHRMYRQNMTFPVSPLGAYVYLVTYTLIIVMVTATVTILVVH